MKILYVVHDFLPKVAAGTELFTYYLARELSKNHDVHLFFNLSDSSETRSLVQGEYENIPFTSINTNLIRFNDYAPTAKKHLVVKYFQELLSSFQPDIVHFQHILHLTPDLVKIAHARNIPIVFTLHDFWLLCHQIKMIKKNNKLCYNTNPLKCTLCYYQNSNSWLRKGNTFDLSINGLKKFYWHSLREYENLRYFFNVRFRQMREVFELVDFFISPSNFLRNMFIRHGLNPDKIVHFQNGIKKIVYEVSHRTHSNTHPNRLQFGYIGGISELKGVPILINAFENISRADLHIFGKLDQKIKNKFINGVRNPNIRFRGFVSGSAKEEALSKIDVFIVPSIWFENSPLVIQEAYMVGAPVIASNIGGMAEFVEDGVTGLHFNVGDYTDLRKKIQYLIDNPQKVSEMRTKLPKVKSIEENALEMETIYYDLKAASRPT